MNYEKIIKYYYNILSIIREEKNNKVEPYQYPYFHEIRWRDYMWTLPNKFLDPMKKERMKANPILKRTTKDESQLELKFESPIIWYFEGKSSQEGKACNNLDRRSMITKWKAYNCSSAYKLWIPMIWGWSILRGDGMLCPKTIMNCYG